MQPLSIRTLSTATLAALLLSTSAPAEEAVVQPTVTVTATRSEQPLDRAPIATTVIDREAIQASQAPDLIDLLARQPGLDVARTGGPGSASTVFVRGTNSNHVLVLVDGIRVASTSQGVFDFAHLPLDQIERIEIVRGPRAAWWGSDAIGGVLQILTRAPTNAARARVGSHGRREGSASVGTSGANGTFGISGGYTDVDGFSAANEKNFSYDPDDDGYRRRHAGLRGETALAHHTLGYSAIATDADVDFDIGRTHARNASGGVSLGGPLRTRWSHSLQVGHAREDLSTPVFGSTFESRRLSADWIHGLELSGGRLDFGLNWLREDGRSTSVFEGTVYDRGRDNRAGFVGYSGRHSEHDYELAARHDDNSQFGSATTASAAWGWRLGEHNRLRAAWGQSFRAPNFNELYSPGFAGLYAGNPALQPERSHSLEAGIELGAGSAGRLAVNLWRTRLGNLIAFSGPQFQAHNVARAASDGAEIEYRIDAGPWSVQANGTWQDARDLDAGTRLLRRPHRKAALMLAHRFGGGAELAAEARHASRRHDFDGPLPSYSLLDLRGSAPFARGWRLDLRLENVTGRDYELVSGYNTPGRSWLMALAWEPPG